MIEKSQLGSGSVKGDIPVAGARTFLPGLALSRAFYIEAVCPILDDAFPGLAHSAGLVGSGSEVLGFDNEMSTDHHWGPRVQIFVTEADHPLVAEPIWETLAQRLPTRFRGYSTHFSPPDPDDHGTQLLQSIESGPVNHRVEILTVRSFVQDYLGHDLHSLLTAADWLTFPQQKLRALTAGAVFHDELGLEAVRAGFAWYPHDVWLYLLASAWARIGQEEHLMGRAGLAGDELGSGLIASRLVRDLMRLAFLMERQYAPYAKWFGTAFAQLTCAPALMSHLLAVQAARTWQERQTHLVPAYETLARIHNQLGVTDLLTEQTKLFFGRPFQVMAQHGFAEALLARIADPAVVLMAKRPPIGNIDLISDNTDLLEGVSWRLILRRLWDGQTAG